MTLNAVLPHVLAAINAATIAALGAGYVHVRAGRRDAHRACMMAALALGTAFLAVYLVYHLGAGLAKFGGQGPVRPIYFSILVIHILAAAVSTPLVPLAAWRGLSGQTGAHRALAPLAWKVWMFVAVSGLVVYVMTVHIWPYAGERA